MSRRFHHSIHGLVFIAAAAFAACGGSEDEPIQPEISEKTQTIQIAATVNFTNEGVSRTTACDIFGCSVTFHNTICNRGTTNGFGSAVGGKWSAGGSIVSACTGLWDAQNTFSFLAPNQCMDVIVFGPGYVGPKLPVGANISYTGMVDFYCNTAETVETDNSRSASFTIP